MSYHCPSCRRIIYSRRLRHCGFCNAEIPEELRFSSEEIAELDKKDAEVAAQRKKRDRDEEDEQRRRDSSSGGSPAMW